MVRWRALIANALLLSQLMILGAPLRAEDGKEAKEAKAKIVNEDPIVDGFFMKRIRAFTREEQEPEDIAFLMFALVAGGSGLSLVKSLFMSGDVFKNMAERKDFKKKLQAKIEEKAHWENHDHDMVKKFISERKNVDALRAELWSAPVEKKAAITKQLRDAELRLSQLGGQLELSKSDCVKLLSYITKLDIADERLAEAM